MKRKVFIIIIMLILIIFSIKVYGKYKEEIYIEAIRISTDTEIPTCRIEYSLENYTNKNVDVIFNFSEEIKPIDGLIKINNFKYKKTLKENNSETIQIEDLAGNKNSISYNVNWIDKICPSIIGITNEATYNSLIKANYVDNQSGIEKVEKLFFGDLEIGIKSYSKTDEYYELETIILRTPKNINNYKFIKENNIFTQTNNAKTFKYRIPINEDFIIYSQVVDTSGKIYTSNKINKNNLDDFVNIYNKYDLNEDLNTFSNPGNYEILVKDKAGNETNYKIYISK